MERQITIRDLQRMKRRGERFAMVTAYDYPTARLVDEAGIPLILVGDSLGMTVLGYETTIPVTMDDMLHHTKAVTRGARRPLVVADLPFLSYQISKEEALRNAARLIQEGGAHAVKLEGGGAIVDTVSRMVAAGIPVMGHLGLTPQSVHQVGGFRVQGKTDEAIRTLLDDALALEAAGAFSVVLELIPAPVAGMITESLDIPTIGIGAGPHCDGQVQVFSDLVNLVPGPVPKHARPYLNAGELIQAALQEYQSDVTAGKFPSEEHSAKLPDSIDPETLKRIASERD